MEALPDLNAEETRYLKRFHRRRTGFAAHLLSVAGLSSYLLVINAITGGGFPWALIPTAFFGSGLIIHWSVYGPRIRKMKREIRVWIGGAPSGAPLGEEGGGRLDEGNVRRSGRRMSEEDPVIVHEAAELRRTILRQIEEMEKDHPNIGEDMRPLLDTYFERVSQLAQKSLDIDRLLTEIPRSDLEEDRTRLKNRMESVESDQLRKEYEKSILQVDRQLASIKELINHSEMLGLRLSSAVNLMKQLQLDLARVKGASLTSASSVGMLKDKADELLEYLRDLEAGYEELESDL